jgi:hypothetical protein
MDRSKAEETLKVLVQHLEAKYERDEAWTLRFKTGDGSCLDELVASACQAVGVAPDDYTRAVESYPDLRQMQKRLICDMMLRPLNPGPDNPRARESLCATVPFERRPWWKFW